MGSTDWWLLITRYASGGRTGVMVLAAVHGISGLTIAGLPIVLSLRGDTRPGQNSRECGDGGLLLLFLEAGKPILA